jgi:hypothetical protein
MDVGANTGKFSCAALAYNDEVKLHLVDLPRQLDGGNHFAGSRRARARHLHPTDLLDEAAFDAGMDGPDLDEPVP